MGDRTLGAAGLALAAFFIWQATRIQTSFISDPVGPKAFPIIIGLVLAASSLAILVRPDQAPKWPALNQLVEIAVTIGVLVAYAFVLPQLGFVISTAFASAFLSWRLGTRPLAAVASGVATSVGLYVVFRLILGLSLATGPLGF